MTSFLALRASVCVVNSLGFYVFIIFWLYDRTLSGHRLQSIIYDANPSRPPLEDRVASGSNRHLDPYNFFSHLERAQFCSDAPPNSNSRHHA